MAEITRILYIDVDNQVESTLKVNGVALTTASTFAVDVKTTSDDASVSGASATWSHVAAGLWRVTIPSTASLALATSYYIEITFADASGNNDYRRIPAVAKYRGAR